MSKDNKELSRRRANYHQSKGKEKRVETSSLSNIAQSTIIISLVEVTNYFVFFFLIMIISSY